MEKGRFPTGKFEPSMSQGPPAVFISKSWTLRMLLAFQILKADCARQQTDFHFTHMT